jgi:hypothetical protein
MKSIIKRLNDSHIFDISINSDSTELTIIECCDYYYADNINKQELKTLIEELVVIHDNMK